MATDQPGGAPIRQAAVDDPGPAAGLTAAEAAARLARDGPNTLPGGGRRGLSELAMHTLREPMFGLLLAASALYLILGDRREGLTLLGFVVVILSVTLLQQGRTERAMAALRDLTSPRALVIRDGQALRIAAVTVVRGDRLKLSEGDRVPADARVLDAAGLQVDESLLTGESVPVEKEAGATVCAGTLVVRGHALAEVTATGLRSEIGRIGAAMASVKTERTPLQRQTAALVRRLAVLALVLSLGLVLIQGLQGGDWLGALLAGIALAMAMLPEEYPVVLTVFPALGARRLAREGVLTRQLSAIETLGATTVLCADKTGTLTANRMAVAQLVVWATGPGHSFSPSGQPEAPLPDAFHELVHIAILASDIDPFDPMERALHRIGRRHLDGTDPRCANRRLVCSYALSPAMRAVTQVWTGENGEPVVVASKGAPESVADLCHFNDARRRELAEAVDALAAQGLRVLAVARADGATHPWPEDPRDFHFEFLGLLGLADPVRPEVPAAVAECRAAGIRVVMITGDYPTTARAIAHQAGLVDGAAEVLSGSELDALDDRGLQARIADVQVCARISPEQKLRIVRALKAQGDVVAMTGDGVNDAPALKAAHVGVAMGGRGTDVARESASLVLVDDNFAALVRAVRLGRRIFDNLHQAMAYTLAVHVPIAGMALLPLLVGWPPVLLPMHIALLELIIDPACSLAFENEPADPALMQRPPRDASAPLFDGAALRTALLQGLAVLAAVMGGCAWSSEHLPEAQARAVAFTALVSGNLSLIVANRSAHAGWWITLRRPNRVFWGVVVFAMALLVGALYVPWMAQVLRLAPLSAEWLAAAVAWGLGGVVVVETLRWLTSPPSLRPGPGDRHKKARPL